MAMRHRDGHAGRIVVLIVVAVLAIALAVIEALAAHIDASPAAAAPWTVHLQRMDNALRRDDVSVAARAWHEAYVAALGSRRWEGMLAVGDAALRLGHASRATRPAAVARAHHAYLAALFRARDDRSLDGVLHVGEAFAALGDTGLAIYCLRIAEPLAAVEPGGSGGGQPTLRGIEGVPFEGREVPGGPDR
jgi:hypothetical protein